MEKITKFFDVEYFSQQLDSAKDLFETIQTLSISEELKVELMKKIILMLASRHISYKSKS